MSSSPNPVERRLLHLCELWSQFIEDPSKRMLLWQLQDNAVRIVHAFLEVQKHQTDYSTRDLFMIFDVPFESSLQYSQAVKAALRGQYEASLEDLRAQGLETDWSFQPADSPDNAAGVMRALCSFGSKYHRAIGHLGAVFTPSAIADSEHFATWLAAAIEVELPERLRLLVLDSLEYPQLRRLLAGEPDLLCVQQPVIDALSVAQETFAQERPTDAAGVFRNMMMGVVALLEKGNADAVKTKARDALAFARKHQWLDQEVALRVMVATALLKESRHAEAVEVYRGARGCAEKTRAANHPAGSQLVLQTWFGEAGVHLAANDLREAAHCYDMAIADALQANQILLAIEAYRMSGFCLARLHEREAARQRFAMALDLGQRLKPESRPMTTLPIAGTDLLRLLDPPRVEAMQHIRHRMDEQLAHASRQFEEGTRQLVDSRGSEVLLQRHEQAMERVEGEAVRQLKQLVLTANPEFVAAFEHAQRLLGADWPLDSALALPPPAAKEDVAA